MPAEQQTAERVGRPYPSRTNVSQACESCRKRKARCSGDRPGCIACTKQGRDCIYAEGGDKRRSESGKHPALPSASASALSSTSIHAVVAAAPGLGEPLVLTPLGDALEEPSTEEHEPWGVGELVLSAQGNLHSNPEATLYRPVAVRLVRPYPAEGLAHYLPCSATYLPIPLVTVQHRQLVDLAFTYGLSLGMNTWKVIFVDSLNKGVRNAFFSPALHLAIIATGLRYCRDPGVYNSYLAPGQAYADRGLLFLDAARREVEKESANPMLSTVLAWLLICATCVHMSLDQLGGQAYARGTFMAADFRVHQQCDEQLKAIKQPLRAMLDKARRDVYGYCLAISAWWAAYYSRPMLPFVETPTQHMSRLHGVCGPHPSAPHAISHAFQVHRTLSLLTLQVVSCNHGARMGAHARAERVTRLCRELEAWRDGMPPCLAWPPETEPPSPSVVTLFASYHSLVIHLLRPYAIERASRGLTGPEWAGVVFEAALDTCTAAAAQIIELVHYVRDQYGMWAAPCNLQDCIYHAATILVFQASGLVPTPPAAATTALASLAYAHMALLELAETWPAAAQAAESVRMLQAQYCVSV
ncbi:hypothetical protein CspeluHIS016_0113700 [Cutaneotrichosporon spelunceum]|uniref:Zn(2)-C6 fungal-type domain-containing protein n=1 Tax=Cutaneotrichosporon spelunceum TaxID=1672016 RepID=A0AAD3TQH8_9TREE|nr:hypothetical protein CspeluHIS016_0113700 [Cutaneotrichosporon spelunceum]